MLLSTLPFRPLPYMDAMTSRRGNPYPYNNLCPLSIARDRQANPISIHISSI